VERLAPDIREAILAIKHHYWNDPRYRTTITSAMIYRAVLDGGVRTVTDFEAYAAGRADPDG
jgi:hypothetical protein